MPEQRQKSDSIFWAALEIDSPQQRGAYLDEACGPNRTQRSQIEEMLAAHSKAEGFLERPAVLAQIVSAGEPVAEKPGGKIGPYCLIEEIGKGGMGNVFMALQEEPVRRKVALKVIKPGMDTQEVIRRFEAERQALAMMDHPNIAKVLDAGSTDSGRLYFVMELVHGYSLIDYCDREQLPTSERLELFIKVCHAVQHAHQKGVIHRDLKPSNVMVTFHDGTPVPKVIDFGIVKAISSSLSDATVTNYAQMIGTPLYMSPEQAEFSSPDVDTRSDVYSLGSLLYELLTGTTPFECRRMNELSDDEVRRVIHEEDPPKPSTRLSTLNAALETAADKRQADPRKLSRLVSGELDWIVMKALEKDRTRRYGTASELANDVQRYLNHDPVSACPPSAMYRLRKTLRRHKTGLAFAAAVSLVVVIGLAGTTWQALVAIDARNLAKQRLGEVEQQREIAENRKEILRQSLYAADIGIAHRVWLSGNRQWALAKVEALRPQADEVDLRGFEWHYLWRLCHSGRRMLPDHAGDVYGVTFSPDGKLLVSASEDQTAKVWDVATGELAATLSEQAGELNCVAFSPDGQLLAIGADNGTVLIRKTDSWDLQATLAGHEDDVCGVAFSPDGRLLASGAWDDKAKLWETAGFTEQATLEGHAHDVEFLAFSPDGKTLATASSDNTVKLWDTAGGKERITLTEHSRQVYGVAYSHNGRWLATCGQDLTARLWDATSGKLLHTLSGHTEWVRDVAFSPDDRTLASCGNDTFVHFWDTTTGERLGTIRANSGRLRGVAYSPDGKTLVTAGSDGIVTLWDATGDQKRTILARSNPRGASISFCQDGRLLMAASVGDGTHFKLCDVTTGNELASFTQHSKTWINAVALAPDGRTFATGKEDGSVTICDAVTGQEQVKLGRHAEDIGQLAFTPDGRTLVMASGANDIKLWDVAGEREPLALAVSNGYFALAPDGQTLATAGEEGSLDLWDTAAGEPRRTLRGHEDEIRALTFSPDGTTLASGSVDHTIILWDPATGQQRGTMLGHADEIQFLAISPDGRTLASSSADWTIRLWNLAARREMMVLERDFSAHDLRFGPDGTSLVGTGSVGIDGCVFLWSAAPLESGLRPRPTPMPRSPEGQP